MAMKVESETDVSPPAYDASRSRAMMGFWGMVARIGLQWVMMVGQARAKGWISAGLLSWFGVMVES